MTPVVPIRPTAVQGFGGVAVTPHVLSTQAAMTVLARGGNAIDAAIAANAVQGVVAPETCGIGGDLFALVHVPGTDEPVALNSTGRAGSGADAARMREAGLDSIPQRHPAAVSVPGCVDGWVALSSRFGSIGLAAVLEPAVDLARLGFPASREMTSAFGARADELLTESGASDMYPDGRAPLVGRKITRGRLAATLETIGEKGREAFYSGRMAEAISKAVDGYISVADLAPNHADWVEPLAVPLFGGTGWTVPPNSQGYISLLAMAIHERMGLGDLDDPASWHMAIESYRQAASDRYLVLSDPESASISAEELVSAERIARLASRIDADKTIRVPASTPASGGTAYMCAIDRTGLGVSLIQSNFHGIGSGRSVPEGGFLLHDRARGFTLEAGHVNELRAGRRPLHTLSPTLWTGPSGLTTLLGTRGGHIQPQLVAQLSTAVVGHGLDPATAMARPRWSTDVPGPTSMDSRVMVEPGTPSSVVSELARLGHKVETLSYPQAGWGPMSVITINDNGLRTGAADPRVETATAAAN